MKKVFSMCSLVLLVVVLATTSGFGKSQKFRLPREASLAGVTLQPGSYRVELNGNDEAEIYQNGKMIVKAKVRVHSLKGAPGNSVMVNDAHVREIRLKKEKLVFVE